MSLALALHVVAAVIWVGGMFFAAVILRPAAAPILPDDRLPMWGRVLENFLSWVWAAVIVLLVSGYYMMFERWGGFAGAPFYVHLMHGLGWIMVLIFLHIWFAPFRRLRQNLAAGDMPAAGGYLTQIRWIVTINMLLGILVVLIASAGRV